MTKITDKLNIIKNAKESIKSSIEAKGVEVGDVSIEEYSSKIDELKTTNLKITSGKYLFYTSARIDIMNELLELCENLTTAEYMFASVNGSTIGNEIDLSNLDTSFVENMSRMFYSMSMVKKINMSNCDAGKVTNISYFIEYSNQVTDLIFMKNLGKGYTQKANNYSKYKLDLSSCTALTHDSLMSVINNLYDLNLTYDVANGGTLYTQSLILGSTNMSKLSAEEIRNCYC